MTGSQAITLDRTRVHHRPHFLTCLMCPELWLVACLTRSALATANYTWPDALGTGADAAVMLTRLHHSVGDCQGHVVAAWTTSVDGIQVTKS